MTHLLHSTTKNITVIMSDLTTLLHPTISHHHNERDSGVIEPAPDKITEWSEVLRWVITPIAFALAPVFVFALLIAMIYQRVVHGRDAQTFWARNLILPALSVSKEKIFEERKIVLQQGGLIQTLLTKDNECLDVVTIESETNKHLPTQHQKWIVYFNGNWGYSEKNFTDMANKSKATGASVISFNYSGVGESKGVCDSSDKIIEDGCTVMRHLERKGVKQENILFYGPSIGGGVSCAVAKEYPEVSIVVDRSFTSLSQTIRSFAWIPIYQDLFAWIVDQWWDLDCLTNFLQVKGKKYLVVANQDFVIRFKEDSLYHAVTKKVQQLPHTILLRYDLTEDTSLLDRISWYIKAHMDNIPNEEFKKLISDWLENKIREPESSSSSLAPSAREGSPTTTQSIKLKLNEL